MPPPAPSRSHPLALPPSLSPDAVDALPELINTLTLLRDTIQSDANGGLGMANQTVVGTDVTGTGTLRPQDLPAATDALKHKLHHARAMVGRLPGMHLTMEEQAAEIQRLEDLLSRQKAVLQQLREAGAMMKTEGAERTETQTD